MKMFLHVFGLVLSVALGVFHEQASAATVVIPNGLVSAEGDSNNAFPFWYLPMRYQQVFRASEFAGLGPRRITHIALRPDPIYRSPVALATGVDIQINLSTTTGFPDGLSSTFADILGSDDTVVFIGWLSLTSAVIGPPAGPKNFDYIIPLQKAFLYDPSIGNLLLDVRNVSGAFGSGFAGDAQFIAGDAVSRVFTNPFDNQDITSPIGGVDTLGLAVQFTLTLLSEGSLVSVTPAKLFTGLKNGDDIGTAFDLMVELHKNGEPVTSGLARCLRGLTRNPLNASEVDVAFDPFDPVRLESGDVLALTVMTRIGTMSDGSRCTGPGATHSSATGLRLYYDSPPRNSRLGVTISPTFSDNLLLHSNGTPCPGGGGPSLGVTNPFLNDSAPTATSSAKCQDSGSLTFAGGNLFKAIGSWSVTVP